MKYLDFADHVRSDENPETLLTLIDLSPSMDEDDWLPSRKAGAIKANKELIKVKLKCHPSDEMGIIGFDGKAKLLHPPVCLTKGAGNLQTVLKDPKGSWGTNFTAALKLAETCFFSEPPKIKANLFSRMLSEVFFESDGNKPKATKDRNRTKRIIMLTDGEHNNGGSPLKVVLRLKNAGVIIDCIGIGGSPKDVDEKLLKQIASRNKDGSVRYCFIGDQQQLLQKYQSLARHIQVL
ncbi:MAG: vWA domain-containing protein [Planctomycetota bacterium]|jgi:Mg-chelatase subunit ChlD